MKFTISYSGKIRVEGREVREVFLSREFDETTPFETAYTKVKAQVETWIRTETERLSKTLQPDTVPETTGSLTGRTKPESATKAYPAIEDVTRVFPQDLAGLLYFEQADDAILIKPRQYLGSENFKKISDIVRDQLGGEYVSARKDSHFKISKDQPPPAPSKTIGFVDEEPEKIPKFDPELIMQWDWKGKKIGEGEYARGSLAWGWDFADNFPENVIKVLEKRPQVIGGYRFTLDPLDKEKGSYVVHVRKERA